VPDVVFEITSKHSKREDEVIKPEKYALMGVGEYFLYDPEGEYLSSPLIGYRLSGNAYKRIELDDRGLLGCRSLGVALELDGSDLVLRDATSRAILLTEAEAERAAGERKVSALEDELNRLRGQLGQSSSSG
jgi:hypothetical protein